MKKDLFLFLNTTQERRLRQTRYPLLLYIVILCILILSNLKILLELCIKLFVFFGFEEASFCWPFQNRISLLAHGCYIEYCLLVFSKNYYVSNPGDIDSIYEDSWVHLRIISLHISAIGNQTLQNASEIGSHAPCTLAQGT